MSTPTNMTPSAAEYASPDETRDLAASFAASLTQQGAATPSHQNEGGISARDWALFRDPVLHNERLDAIRQKKGFIIDMDGVIYHVSCINFVVLRRFTNFVWNNIGF